MGPASVVELERLVTSGRLNDSMARQVWEGVLSGEGTPTEVADARGLELVQDTGALEAAVDAVIAANPDVADKIRDGKVAAVGALIGQVMREMKGQADAGAARAIILERLGQSSRLSRAIPEPTAPERIPCEVKVPGRGPTTALREPVRGPQHQQVPSPPWRGRG